MYVYTERKIKGLVPGKDLSLKANGYIVIEPGVSINIIIKILENATGLTIKALVTQQRKTS